jgi:hypothetical protein
LRAGFALFFYSSFIIGLATIVWWQKNKIQLYPFIQIAGVALLLYSIFLRRRLYQKKAFDERTVTEFYTSLFLLTISLALGYSSIFLIAYVIIIGLPLVILQKNYERNNFKAFIKIINSVQGYTGLQQKYIKLFEKQQNSGGKK